MKTILMLALILTLAACNSIRQVTYPQGFIYLDSSDIQSSMGKLAVHITALDQYLSNPDQLSANRQKVLEALGSMSRIANELGAGATQTNHLLLDAHIDDFKQAVETARLRLQINPDNFSGVGQLVGSCSACHRLH